MSHVISPQSVSALLGRHHTRARIQNTKVLTAGFRVRGSHAGATVSHYGLTQLSVRERHEKLKTYEKTLLEHGYICQPYTHEDYQIEIIGRR